MTVSSATVFHDYLPGAAMAEHALPGLFWRAPAVLVVTRVLADGTETVLAEGTDYQLGGDGSSGTGWIKALAVELSTTVFHVERQTPRTQERALPRFEPLDSKSLERGLDQLAMVDQELGHGLGDLRARALLVPEGEVAPPLGSLAAAEGKVLGMVAGEIVPVANDAVGAAASAAAAAASAATAAAAAASVGVLAPVFAFAPAARLWVPPAGMNNPLRANMVSDGRQFRFDTDIHEANDWANYETGITHLYLTDAGSDANAGTSEGTAWYSIDKVLASAPDKSIIHNRRSRIGYLSWTAGNFNAGVRRLKWIGEATPTEWNPTGRVWLTSWRESYNLAFLGWVVDGAAWKTSAAVNPASIGSVCDARWSDPWGNPLGYKWVVDAATCKATPGSFFTNNVDVWVNTIDGRVPDPDDGILFGTSFSGFNYTADAHSTFENLGFCFNGGLAAVDGFRWRPATAFVPNTYRLAMKGLRACGASGNGFQVLDAWSETQDDCHAAWNHYDDLNSTSFITTGTQRQWGTNYITRSGGHHPGYAWRSFPTPSSSNNVLTGHRAMHRHIADVIGFECPNSVLADVNGCSTMVGGARLGRATGSGGALFQNAAWYQRLDGEGSAGAKMIMLGCQLDGDAPGGSKFHLSNRNDADTAPSLGQFHIADHLSSPNVNVPAGTLLHNYHTGAPL